MEKIGHVIKELLKLNYKKIKNKTTKKKIIKDASNSINKYQATSDDYERFAMYELDDIQKSTIITKGINEDIIKKYNNPEYFKYFTDKILFYKKFNKYLMRNWLLLTENYEEYNEFVKKNKVIIATSLKNPKIPNKKYEINQKNKKKIYKELIDSDYELIEEEFSQCDEFNKLNKNNIVRIKTITLNNKIVASYLYIKDDVELIAPINIETGIVDYSLVDKEGNIYEKIPSTNESIVWFTIPKWPRIKRFINNLTLVETNIKYVEWDISLNKDPYIISANIKPDHRIYQLPEHRIKGQGLLPIFKKAMEEENENSYSNRS